MLNNTAQGVTETAALDLWFSSGGRGVDTAFNYAGIDGCGQQCVGRAIRNATASGIVHRRDMFVTTKIPCIGGAASALQYIQQDLAALNLSYVDLVLIHSPGDCAPAQTTHLTERC